MNAQIFLCFSLTVLLSACAPQEQPLSVALKQKNPEAEAIAVVLAEIERQGGDPSREECSARKIDDEWSVTAWHIWYPENTGSSRFVPGGFTTYVVNSEGKIVSTLPGL